MEETVRAKSHLPSWPEAMEACEFVKSFASSYVWFTMVWPLWVGSEEEAVRRVLSVAFELSYQRMWVEVEFTLVYVLGVPFGEAQEVEVPRPAYWRVKSCPDWERVASATWRSWRRRKGVPAVGASAATPLEAVVVASTAPTLVAFTFSKKTEFVWVKEGVAGFAYL